MISYTEMDELWGQVITTSQPYGVANIARTFDDRGRITSETDGGNAATTLSAPGKGSINLSGAETSGVVTSEATAGSGVITVSGYDGSQNVCTTTYEWVDAGDSGEIQVPITTCNTVPNTGTLSVTIGGFTATASYGSSSTAASLAAALAAGLNGHGSPVRAVASGGSITVTAIATGIATNFPISTSFGGGFTISPTSGTLSGGQNGGTVYDAGLITATITNNSALGSAVLTVSGSDGSQNVCTTTYEWVNAGDSGEIQVPVSTTCNPVADTGALSVTIGGFTATASYGSSSTAASLAAALAAGLNGSGSPVRATASGGSIAVTTIATGVAENYPITTSSGGGFAISPAGGSLSVPANASYSVSASWGQGSTPGSIAASLASAIDSAAPIVTATVSGGSVQLVSTAPGSNTNYAVSVAVSDSQTANYPTLFSSPSFSASASSMTGGRNASSTYGTVYSYSVPAGGYAANGNLLGYIDSTVMGEWNFGYDTLNRLVSGNATSGPYNGLVTSWTYDAFGNRTAEVFGGSTSEPMPTTSTASYNADNRVTASSLMLGQPLGYDAAGDVTADNANQYAYDGEGRLCAVSNASGKWGYLYNADGERVAKGEIASLACPDSAASFTSVEAEYLLNAGGEQATELNGAGAWVHTNVWAGGSLDATYDGSGLHFQLADPLGTRRVQLSAATGCAEESFQSLPWGNGLTPTPGCGSAADATEQHFTGKVRDAESGNDYFGARYYASTMGRFLSPDYDDGSDPDPVPYADLVNPQSLNLYAYAYNNPLTNIDGDGHLPCGGSVNITVFVTPNGSSMSQTPDCPSSLSAQAKFVLSAIGFWARGEAAQLRLSNAQNAAINNPNFRPNTPSQGTTHCNQAVCAEARAVGAPMGPLTDAHGRPLLANQIRANLAKLGSGYHEVSATEAERLAESGVLVIVTGPGHVATVAANQGSNAPGRGPVIANVGRTNGNMRLSRVFRQSAMPEVKFYAPNQ